MQRPAPARKSCSREGRSGGGRAGGSQRKRVRECCFPDGAGWSISFACRTRHSRPKSAYDSQGRSAISSQCDRSCATRLSVPAAFGSRQGHGGRGCSAPRCPAAPAALAPTWTDQTGVSDSGCGGRFFPQLSSARFSQPQFSRGPCWPTPRPRLCSCTAPSQHLALCFCAVDSQACYLCALESVLRRKRRQVSTEPHSNPAHPRSGRGGSAALQCFSKRQPAVSRTCASGGAGRRTNSRGRVRTQGSGGHAGEDAQGQLSAAEPAAVA